MKIGILTYHRSHNYGALLQAVALRHVLKQMGHEVYFVDYWPEYHQDFYKTFNLTEFRNRSIIPKLKYILKVILTCIPINKRKKSFLNFIGEYISPYSLPQETEFDMIVCGSDQIWRKQPGMNNRLNPMYFGKGNIHTKSLCSYAASMGMIDLNYEDKVFIKESLKDFNGVGVREKDLEETLVKLGVERVKRVLDPTLLLSSQEWVRLLPINNEKPVEKYILFYDLLKNSFDIEAIKRYSEERNLRLIILKGEADALIHEGNVLQYENPLGMMKLIANAEFVFTSSFHGLVFSILFNKEFITSFRANSKRAQSLLSMLGIEERLVSSRIKKFPKFKSIDYCKVNDVLFKERENSMSFLKEVCQ